MLAFALACGAGFALPGRSAADNGGAAAPVPVTTGGAIAEAAGSDGITLQARSGAIVEAVQRFRGTVPNGAGKTILIQVESPNGTWQTAAQATVAPDGTYLARWRSRHIGRFQARALISGASASSTNTAPVITVTVHHAATATWYGPGFYGKKTACGITLTQDTVGVAHRDLPCGTQVSILYHGRSIVVPVIDRGPFANGADWDLTQAAAQSLGITETARVGELALRG